MIYRLKFIAITFLVLFNYKQIFSNSINILENFTKKIEMSNTTCKNNFITMIMELEVKLDSKNIQLLKDTTYLFLNRNYDFYSSKYIDVISDSLQSYSIDKKNKTITLLGIEKKNNFVGIRGVVNLTNSKVVFSNDTFIVAREIIKSNLVPIKDNERFYYFSIKDTMLVKVSNLIYDKAEFVSSNIYFIYKDQVCDSNDSNSFIFQKNELVPKYKNFKYRDWRIKK